MAMGLTVVYPSVKKTVARTPALVWKGPAPYSTWPNTELRAVTNGWPEVAESLLSRYTLVTPGRKTDRKKSPPAWISSAAERCLDAFMDSPSSIRADWRDIRVSPWDWFWKARKPLWENRYSHSHPVSPSWAHVRFAMRLLHPSACEEDGLCA